MRIRDDEAVHWASIVRQWLVLGGTQLVDTGEFLMALGQYRACMPSYIENKFIRDGCAIHCLYC